MPKRYFAKFAPRICANGYDVLPITPGTKAPTGLEKDGVQWRTTFASAQLVDQWAQNGFGGHGIGINATHTPAVDIDSRDKTAVAKVVDFVEMVAGEGIQRIGSAPKTLMIFRTDEPFHKLSSKVYLDDRGNSFQVEILGDGQQFVAAAVHPDTKQPYTYPVEGRSPLRVKRDELPLLSEETAQKIVDFANEYAEKKGWQVKRRKSLSRLSSKLQERGRFDENDPFIADRTKPVIAEETLLRYLDFLSDEREDYETWIEVGQALHHHYDGDDQGFDIWDEWSSQATGADKYQGRESLIKHWESFGQRTDVPPLTARIIIKWGREEEKNRNAAEAEAIQTEMQGCNDRRQLEALAGKVQRLEIDVAVRKMLAAVYRDAFARVYRPATCTASEALKALRFRKPPPEMPKWLEPILWVENEGKFYSRRTRALLAPYGFNLTYARRLMSEDDIAQGKSRPETEPTDFALNVMTVPHVANVMYVPAEEELFDFEGTTYGNSFRPDSIPEPVERLQGKGAVMVERLQKHVAHLFPDEREQGLLLSFFAYIVQTKGRVNWAPVIQGTRGDGKTFFFVLMQAVLGGENVNTVGGSVLMPGNSFTEWTHGHLCNFIEEVRVGKRDSTEVLDRLKPYITNTTIDVHPKGKSRFKAVNTCSHVCLTNHQDALPAPDDRYCVFRSQWQTDDALKAFKRAEPDYYEKLYEVPNYAQSIVRFLTDYKLHEDFTATGRAPATSGNVVMTASSKNDYVIWLEEQIGRGLNPLLTRECVSVNEWRNEMMADNQLEDVNVSSQALRKQLLDLGFQHIIERMDLNEGKHTIFSATPDLFTGKDVYQVRGKVKKYLKTFQFPL